MEYCEGGTLEDKILKECKKGRCMNENEVLRCLLDICEGINYLHENGIIHRDIKPQNIFIDSKNVLKIGDFGVSREIGKTLRITKCGTPNFMSFEMLGDQPYDEMTDMYSLGITLFSMLTGGRSMMLTTEIQKDKNIFEKLENEIVSERGYDKEIFQLFQKLVNYEPQKRPTPRETMKIVKLLIKKQITQVINTKDALKSFHKLDKGCAIYIFSFLECIDVYNVMRVSKSHYYLCQEEELWRRICENELGEMTEINDLKLLKKKPKKEENESWKKYMLRYVDFQGRTLTKRKRDTLGKVIVSELHPDSIDQAAIVLAKSYSNNPCFNYIFNGWKDEDKLSALAFLMVEEVKRGLKYGRVHCTTKYDRYNKSQIIAVAIWNTPYNTNVLTSWKKLKNNYLLNPVIKQTGLIAFTKLMSYFEMNEKIYTENMKDEKKPHWTLLFVGCLPGFQSKGIGTNVLMPILKKADKMNFPCCLVVNEPKALKFFTRLGFTVKKKLNHQNFGEITFMKRTSDEVFIHEN